MIAQVLALVLLLTPASEGPAPSRRVALEIDHTPLLLSQDTMEAEEIATFLREDTVAALQKGYAAEVVEDATAPTIVVELGWTNYAKSIYRITVRTRRAGEEPRTLEAYDCSCIDSGVIESVLDRLPKALAQLDEEPPAPAEPAVEEPELEPEPEAEPEEQTAPDSATQDSGRKAAPIGALGISGAVVAAGGLGALSFGISRLAKGEESSQEPDDEMRGSALDFRPQGGAWLGVGVGAMAVGAAMLAVDLTVLRRRRAARVALGPAGGPSWTGIQVQGRF